MTNRLEPLFGEEKKDSIYFSLIDLKRNVKEEEEEENGEEERSKRKSSTDESGLKIDVLRALLVNSDSIGPLILVCVCVCRCAYFRLTSKYHK